MSEKMKTLNKERLVSIANIETGEVKRVNAEAVDKYFEKSVKFNKRIWFYCGKSIWKRFKETNADYIAGNSKELTPLVFTQEVDRKVLKPNDTIYLDQNGDTVLILININVENTKGYNRRDIRRCNGKTKSSPDVSTQCIKSYGFKNVIINANEFDDMIQPKAKTYHRLRKGSKLVKPNTVATISVPTDKLIRKYDKGLISLIRRQLRHGANKLIKEGTLVDIKFDKNDKVETVTVLMPTKQTTVKTVTHSLKD